MIQEVWKRKLNIGREAKAFLIWREGRSVDWDRTVADLAEATGIRTETVRSICRQRKWPVQPGTPGPNPAEARDPDDLADMFDLADLTPQHKDPVAALLRSMAEAAEEDEDEEILAPADD